MSRRRARGASLARAKRRSAGEVGGATGKARATRPRVDAAAVTADRLRLFVATEPVPVCGLGARLRRVSNAAAGDGIPFALLADGEQDLVCMTVDDFALLLTAWEAWRPK